MSEKTTPQPRTAEKSGGGNFLTAKGPFGLPNGVVYGGGALAGVAGYRWWKNRQAGSSSSASSTPMPSPAPVTGGPYPPEPGGSPQPGGTPEPGGTPAPTTTPAQAAGSSSGQAAEADSDQYQQGLDKEYTNRLNSAEKEETYLQGEIGKQQKGAAHSKKAAPKPAHPVKKTARTTTTVSNGKGAPEQPKSAAARDVNQVAPPHATGVPATAPHTASTTKAKEPAKEPAKTPAKK